MEEFITITGTDIEAAKIFLGNGLPVGIPTETVYGLAANALDEDAVLKIFQVKNRPHFDPLIVHTHSIAGIEKYVKEIPACARVLMERFMPGALTLLLKKRNFVPDIVTSGLDTVAIRIPNHALTLQLLRELSFPLAAPSANPFGYISPTTAKHVFEQLHNKIPYILDGGPTTVGVESTIVGFDGEQAIIYRLGGVTVEQIEAAIGPVKINISSSSNPKAPGALKSHYAPAKNLVFDDEETLAQLKASGQKVGIIAFDSYLPGFSKTNQELLSTHRDLEEAAKALFSVMRQLDASDVDIIYAVKFPDEDLGRAINDRLQRAAAK